LSISSHTSAREHFSKKRAINQAVLLCDIRIWRAVAVAKRSFFMVSTNCQAPGIELGIVSADTGYDGFIFGAPLT
jgi:hypothetical protein